VVTISLAAPWLPSARAQSRGEGSGERRPGQRTTLEKAPDALAELDRTVRAAESSLRDGELQQAESLYRTALFDAWMMLGGLHVAAGRMQEARHAFDRASRSVVEADAALQALAVVDLQTGRATEAVDVLTRLAGRHEKDVALQRLLAQALMANGQVEEAVQAFETARATDPADPELAFLLGSAYLRVKKVDGAERLFAAVAKARPGASTDVLLGRTYRDAALYERARVALQRALRRDPKVLRAHYYLGTVAVLEQGVLGLDTAIREFEAELQLTPKDVVTNLRLGMALVEAQRAAEALPHLEIASRSEPIPAEVFYYLGRCHLAMNRAAKAVEPFRRALSLAGTMALDDARVGNIHYQLALALRQAGREPEAAAHFEEARRASARRADSDRESLSRYMADAPEPPASSRGTVLPVESPLASHSPEQRAAVERQLAAAITRAYMNLGVMHAQAQRFSRAADMFVDAAAVDADFPQVQYSLGVAYFNDRQYAKAAGPLTRALAANPSNAVIRRMLGLAWFHSENYENAAEVIGSDPARESDPSLQYAYALALVRSDRAALAEPIFAQLIEQHGNRAELHVVIGQAHAHQGDYAAAIESLTRALQLEPGVAEANTTLGIIYLKQGRLPDARAALEAELGAHPGDVRARHTLATVLDLEGRSDEALSILRPLVRTRPEFADGRYLLGKILLAQGAVEDAVDELLAAVRLSPEDANAHYQLGQAYQKLGRPDLADEQFKLFKELKDKQRGGQL
jgi:tetratricopeptide (TPR) repeat protein